VWKTLSWSLEHRRTGRKATSPTGTDPLAKSVQSSVALCTSDEEEGKSCQALHLSVPSPSPSPVRPSQASPLVFPYAPAGLDEGELLTARAPAAIQARLRAILGSIWDRISAEDEARRHVPGLKPPRHLLAVLYERAGQYSKADLARRFPGRLAELTALSAVVSTLERMRKDEALSELIPGLADRRQFRHHMLTLALADYLRKYTDYVVRLPPKDESGRRVVDLLYVFSS
jgi:hypothetical protein